MAGSLALCRANRYSATRRYLENFFNPAPAIYLWLLIGLPFQVWSANGDWPLHGLNAAETRHSPLKQIHTGNIARLGLAWDTPLDSKRGLEATPIVVGGVMYLSSTWSRVYALDARNGKLLWHSIRKSRGNGAAKVVATWRTGV